ncbi:MAG: Fpg/Nei family DNA glycosylase [Candidatus Aminicenantia bacterium]
MAELPEIIVITNQMKERIEGKVFKEIEVLQKKCLNYPVKSFIMSIKGEKIREVSYKGKWFIIHLERGFLLINLGMGGDMVYFLPDKTLPEKYQFKFLFNDGTGFTIRFWWFGYVHYVNSLEEHKIIKNIGPSPLDPSFTLEKFKELLKGRKGSIKSFLLNQKNISGIGNFYIHDILFEARLHPLKKVEILSENEKISLYNAIMNRLNLSLELGGADYELDFTGKKGGFGLEDHLVGYKEGKDCPQCGNKILKLKTGGNHSFICPSCQKL